MGFALERIANGKGSLFGDGQSVGGCKRRTNVTTSVADNLGMIFEPKKESLFELATKWLPDMGSSARFEAGNPPRNGATCNFEQINAINSWYNHWYPYLS